MLYMHLAKDLHPGYIKNFYYGTRKKRQMCNPIKIGKRLEKTPGQKKKKRCMRSQKIQVHPPSGKGKLKPHKIPPHRH